MFPMNLRWLFALLGALALPQDEITWDATRPVFAEAGPGVTAIRAYSTPAGGNYYVLRGTVPEVLVFGADGKLASRIALGHPPTATPDEKKQPAVVYGNDLDVDAAGRFYIADRGGNAVKVFEPTGRFLRALRIAGPTSVACLPDGEVAVASLKSETLITVFDGFGREVRAFGELTDLAARAELSRYLNVGRLARDARHNLYFSFSYLPEPTVRKYDRFGYLAAEIEATSLDVAAAAQATRREISRQERGGPVGLKPTITALGVDPEKEEIWLATGGVVMHFDAEGQRLRSYRVFTDMGQRLEAVAILVEAKRLLMASETLGIFEFPRPDHRR